MDEHSLFLNVLERETPADQAAYLADVCGDDEDLRKRVEALLRAHAMPHRVLDGGVGPTIDQLPITERPGTQIGPYKLLQQIGEGGMGVVYMAEQTEPVERRVALKIIKPGMDTHQVIARFEAERQALAMMDHPNIAKVLDAGTTDSGRPFFIMELVKGIPFTKYCDDQHLTPKERLELFIPICQAVQHAHHKGIIHRDIKPSNVLVALYDGQPVPKVIDFGVAKATSQKLTEKTMFTQYGQIVGTLEYMSPEQADLNQLEIDTRSDIYSLGVLLYELLTGATPFDRARLRSAAFEEMLRIVREEEPPRPSTRLSTIDTLPTVAANRHTHPKKLSALVRGELDWIVMKALDKDRARRYETASGFAKDIQRYLNDEAVVACPPSAAYRFRKFARRNKAGIATTSVVVAALVVGIAGTTWQAVRATRAEHAAETRFQLAKEAVDEYLNLVTEDEQLKNADFFQLRKKLLEAAVPFYEKLANEKSEIAGRRAAQGDAWYRLGVVHGELGEHDVALKDFENMRNVFQNLVSRDPAIPVYRQRLAVGHENRATALLSLGKFRAADKALANALAVWEELVTEFPDVAGHRNHLAAALTKKGLLLKRFGQETAAQTVYERTIALSKNLVAEFPGDREYLVQLARSSNDLGLLLRRTGQKKESRELLGQALNCYQRLSAESPNVPEYRRGLGAVHHNLANLLPELQDLDEARRAFEQSLLIRQQLTDDFPSVPDYRRSLAMTHNDFGHFRQKDPSDLDGALREFQSAINEYEKLKGHFDVMPDLGRVHHNVGWLLRQQHNYPAAKLQLEKSIAVWSPLVATHQDIPAYRAALATSWNDLGVVLWDQQDLDGARKAYQQALEYRRELVRRNKEIPEYRVSLGGTCCNLGQIEVDARQPKASLPWFAEAQELLEDALRRTEYDRAATLYLRNVHWCRAEVYEKLARFTEAAADWAKAVQLARESKRARFRRSLALALAQAGDDTRAVAEATGLVDGSDRQPLDLMTAAIVFSHVSGRLEDDPPLKERYAVRAVELLELAAKEGIFATAADVDRLKTHRGFDSLRSRPDFQRLLEELMKEAGSSELPPADKPQAVKSPTDRP